LPRRFVAAPICVDDNGAMRAPGLALFVTLVAWTVVPAALATS